MSNSPVKNRSTRYGLITFLIISLFLTAAFFYLRNNNGNSLNQEITQLQELNEDYSKIDSCILILYNADNNCRLYTVTGNKNYIKNFFSEINFVFNVLNNIHQENGSDNLQGLFDQKKSRTEFYLKLKELTDSLVSNTKAIDTVSSNFNFFKNKTPSYKQVKTIIKVDTISSSQQKIVKEKKFFGRLVDAFSKRSSKIKAVDTSIKYVRTETKLDTSFQTEAAKKIFTNDINGYNKQLYRTNSVLDKNEIQILEINNKIITAIVSLLNDHKNKEKKFVAESRSLLISKIDKSSKNIDNLFFLSFGVLLLLLITIMYNLWKIYKNESELINYGQKAAQLATSKSRFLANMSHEIRTPLNSVVGFSEQLSQGDLNQEQSQQVNAIRSSSVMLLDVVNDILDFSKYETGKVSFDKIPFIAYDAIIDVFNSITIQARKKGIELRNEILFNKDFCFNGDSLRLKQVIMNLLSNAIKFTDRGDVTLKAEVVQLNKKSCMLKIQIIDTGIGISKEDLAMIFDEFAQVYYSANKIKNKGTGLGLAICKKIIEFQGGQIEVKSELKKGSIFSFEIPYDICQKENVLQRKSIIITKGGALEGKHVLLADDNKMNILLAQTVLKKYKLKTDIAYDGKEAFALFENNLYDLILTDIQMPEMGGVELTRRIRKYHDQTKINIPILGVTANVLEEDRIKYIESGINDLVLKPFSEKELIDKIADYIK